MKKPFIGTKKNFGGISGDEKNDSLPDNSETEKEKFKKVFLKANNY